jgi:hypothetical protein
MKVNIPSNLIKNETQIQALLIKSEQRLKSTKYSDYKFVNEYSEALADYFDEVTKGIINGLSLSVGVNPNNLKKSLEIPINDLIRIDRLDIEDRMFYKSLFSKMKKGFTKIKQSFKKFMINRGKPVAPLNFNNMFKYSPEEKNLLTNEEWDDISDGIVDYLDDYISGPADEMAVRASLFGKLISAMKEEGMTQEEVENMSWSQIEKKFGKLPTTKTEAQKKFELKQNEVEAIGFAQRSAGEYLSVNDSDLKNKIVNTTRNVIEEGLRENKTSSQMVSELYHTSKKEKRESAKVKDFGYSEWNRDFKRIIQTETSEALNSGFMIAEKNRNEKEGIKKTYMVYAGAYNPDEKPDEPCNIWIGEIVLVVDTPMDDDRINDKYAKYAVWPGKNNVGRKKANWWIAIPSHPFCRHYYENLNPAEQEWDKEYGGVVYKED